MAWSPVLHEVESTNPLPSPPCLAAETAQALEQFVNGETGGCSSKRHNGRRWVAAADVGFAFASLVLFGIPPAQILVARSHWIDNAPTQQTGAPGCQHCR
jgi:hypothetical protein